jgi:NADH-quinone oxidoreductase subunit J
MSTLFITFNTGALVSAALMLISKNPVHAVFYLVSVFLHLSGLLCMLGLEYFALLQLLVYVGALAIMFLFVVMLLDIPATEIVAYQRGTYPGAGILLCALVLAIYNSLTIAHDQSPIQLPILQTSQCFFYENSWQTLEHSTNLVTILGIFLYGIHVDLLIIASYILLVAMVGAVALTLKRRVQAPIHDVFVMHNRDFSKIVTMVRGCSIF